ncbi:putative transcription factor interactor and regulator CCHC(Zn) family [Helianthus annuus]|nr:putative transcription factor interactor and regulator CCHC(Zn) family [Helianthus annuus]KAJ0607413.1 putative transcription factor interactor and regulator CCHC(Zn) family [Helianthus annuus]KAJ0767469.1 putative transcription factor interactor and regulator CCHC(Zn) family [Helianthus annuus]
MLLVGNFLFLPNAISLVSLSCFPFRMPPRRNNQIPNEELAAIIMQQITAAIPNIVAQCNQALNNNNAPCNFKTFNSAKPSKFSGSQGATALLQWFESLESTFRHVQCPNERKVDFASSVFEKRALTWWNGVMRDRGADVALAQTWEELRALMMKELCPRHEIRALEREFDDLKQDSGEHRAYTDRYEELSLLCPSMVTPLDKAIEKYIDGLPDSVQDIVTGSNPTTVRKAIELSATLTESQIRKRKLFRKGDKKPIEESKTMDEQTGSPKKSKKRKASQNFAMVTHNDQAVPNQPAQPPARKPYNGNSPLCNQCNLHHHARVKCRECQICGLKGHTAKVCRAAVAPNQADNNPAQARFPPGSCYNCGEMGHFRRNCPKLANANPAQ